MRAFLFAAVFGLLPDVGLDVGSIKEDLREKIAAIEGAAKQRLFKLGDTPALLSPSSLIEVDAEGLPPLHVDLDEKKDAEYEEENAYAKLLKQVGSIQVAGNHVVEETNSKIEGIGKGATSLLQDPKQDAKDLSLASEIKKMELATKAEMEVITKKPVKAAPSSLLQTTDPGFTDEDVNKAVSQGKKLIAEERAFNAKLQRDMPSKKHKVEMPDLMPASLLEHPHKKHKRVAHHKHWQPKDIIDKSIEDLQAEMKKAQAKAAHDIQGISRGVFEHDFEHEHDGERRHGHKRHSKDSLLETETADVAASPWIDDNKVDQVFSDLNSQLEQITGKTHATLQALEGEAEASAHPNGIGNPSSFIETASYVAGGRLVGLDAAYKQLDAQLKRVQAETKAQVAVARGKPSSFLERGVTKTVVDVQAAFADLDKKLDNMKAKTQSRMEQTRNLEDQLHIDPSSLVQRAEQAPEFTSYQDLQRRIEKFEKKAKAINAEEHPESLLEGRAHHAHAHAHAHAAHMHKAHAHEAPQLAQSEYARQLAAQFHNSYANGFDNGYAQQEAKEVDAGAADIQPAGLPPVTSSAPYGRASDAYGSPEAAPQFQYGNFAADYDNAQLRSQE